MYKIDEKSLNVLLCEGTSLIDKLVNTHSVSLNDVQHFGNALCDVQTEVHHQAKTQFNGLAEEKLVSSAHLDS